MGKAIYNPSGKAKEFSYWAVNFYNGCSADCEYCYCKQGVLKTVWSDKPTLKKTLVSEEKALEIFKKEADKNIIELREHGLFFNFTSDPFLKETIDLNIKAMRECEDLDIPVKALTKQTWWIGIYKLPKNVSVGFTLTGHDELEAGAATNKERIHAIEMLHLLGYKIWASIEPIIDLPASFKMIMKTIKYVSHYKIGLLSGGKADQTELFKFVNTVNMYIQYNSTATLYWKDSLLEQAGIDRENLPDFCVDRDYRWWL